MRLNIGDVIYFRSPDSPEPHYTIVVGHLSNGDLLYACVSITSSDSNYYDTACLLDGKDYSHLYKDSWVYYKRLGIYKASLVEEQISKDFCKIMEPLGRKSLNKVMTGGLNSKHITPRYKRFFEKYFEDEVSYK